MYPSTNVNSWPIANYSLTSKGYAFFSNLNVPVNSGLVSSRTSIINDNNGDGIERGKSIEYLNGNEKVCFDPEEEEIFESRSKLNHMWGISGLKNSIKRQQYSVYGDGERLSTASERPLISLGNNPEKEETEEEIVREWKKSSVEGTPEGWFELNLSGRGLKVLSAEVRNYIHLTALDVSENCLRTLPSEMFYELRALRVLDLSTNELMTLPHSIGQLQTLTVLDLRSNRLQRLPLELGRLFRLKTLALAGNPLVDPPAALLVDYPTDQLIAHLRDRLPTGSPPPVRRFISYVENAPPRSENVRVLSFNVLAENFAANERYFYCPSWALDWNYRRRGILRELLAYDCDVLCLQEVESSHYREYFQPHLADAGFEGIFSPKSRARTMDNWEMVDGCAIFYKKDKFILLESHAIEFQSIAMSRHEDFAMDQEAFSRLITKDNIALAVVLQMKDSVQSMPMLSSSFSSSSSSYSNYRENDTEYPSIEETITNTSSFSLDDMVPNSSNPFSIDSRNSSQNNVRIHTRSSFLPVGREKTILISNTHIHWNPEHKDVKLIQVQFLLEKLMALTDAGSRWHRIPMVVCGDFNSTSDSGPYELLSNGKLKPHHEDLSEHNYGTYSSNGMEHYLALSSAYAPIGEPPFTNYTGDFVGVLDYLWFTHENLAVSKVLQPVDEEIVKLTRLPNAYLHSDHISIVSEFFFKNDTPSSDERFS